MSRSTSTLSFLRLIYSVSEVCPPCPFQLPASPLDGGNLTSFITVGPSSSHTVGPMRAGKIFIGDLEALGLLEKVMRSYVSSVLTIPHNVILNR